MFVFPEGSKWRGCCEAIDLSIYYRGRGSVMSFELDMDIAVSRLVERMRVPEGRKQG